MINEVRNVCTENGVSDARATCFYGWSSHSISSIVCAEFGNVDRRASTKACHHLLLPPVEYQGVCGYCLVTRTRVALSPGASPDD